ncbi:uncharacterized protein METZ01_LOCUS463573, partial [marine metagenome]
YADNCGTCDDDSSNDCVQDCAGTWGGSLVNDDCGVCDGGNADDLGCGCFEAGPSGCDNVCNSTAVVDCAGVCGGDSVLSGCDNTCNSTLADDECGVCDGDGSSCSSVTISFGAFTSDSVEILYTSSGDISGYQFDVSGLDGLTVSAGNFMASAANGTVIGFSLTGDTLPAGSGTLATLGYSTVTDQYSSLSLGNFGAITDGNGNPYATVSFGDDEDHGPADCAGTFGGLLVDDDCGVCDGGNADDLGCG